jgi:hypothetical protein
MFKELLEKLKGLVFEEKVEAPEEAKDGFGLIEAKPEPEDFTLGGPNQALKMVLSPERDYTDFLPVHETQKKNFDSYSCVVFSGLNCLEIAHKKQFGKEINFSDRFIAGMIPVTPNRGTTFAKFADAVRKNGLVLEEEYPWGGDNGRDYVKHPPSEVIEKAKASKSVFEIQHEWIDWGGCDPLKLWEAMIYGVEQVSVNAGALYTGEINKNVNHAVVRIGGEKFKKHIIWDQYFQQFHEVPWNFYFGSAKQYSLLKKKYIPLIQVYGKPPVYAIFGNVASHIVDEKSWHYGEKIGAWEKKIKLISQAAFDRTYTKGKPILFK